MGGCIHFIFVYQQIMQRLNILNFNVNDLDGGGIQPLFVSGEMTNTRWECYLQEPRCLVHLTPTVTVVLGCWLDPAMVRDPRSISCGLLHVGCQLPRVVRMMKTHFG